MAKITLRMYRTPEETLMNWTKQLNNVLLNLDTTANVTIGADAIDSSMIDWGTGVGQIDARDIPVYDADGYFSTDLVENALKELYELAYNHIHSDGSDHTYIDQDVTTGSSPTFAGLDLSDGSLENIKQIIFDTTPASPGTTEGTVYWNGTEYTLNVVSGLGTVLQVGQEIVVIVYNNTASLIEDGKVVHPVAGFTNGFVHIEKAIADTHEGITNDIWLTTMDIPAGSAGFATKFGIVNDIDTSAHSVGTIWVSATTAGEYTNTRPAFPNYEIRVGAVEVQDAVNGRIGVSVKGTKEDTIINFWNGVFRETFDFRISSDGTTITGSLEPSNGHDDMTMLFSDGFTMLDTNPAVTVTLTPGTDTNPQTNYVYIPQSTKVLTVSTSGFPTTEHIKVAQCAVCSASRTKSEGALRNQNINDAIESTSTYQGHLSHIGEKIRKFEAQWNDGIEGSSDITANVVTLQNTSGHIYQMHKHSFPNKDTRQYDIDAVTSSTFTISDDGDLSSTYPDGKVLKVNDSTGNDGIYTVASTSYSAPDFVITVEETIPDLTVDGTIGDDASVVNDYTTPFVNVADLTDITTDASGNSLNNTSFSFVVWGVGNKTGEVSHLMINLPTDTYSKNFPNLAVSDANNYSVYTIPTQFQGVGFLIARHTYVNSGGTWSLYDTEDLRGRVPNTTAGGGGGGTGVVTFTGLNDTPNAYTGEALSLAQVNAGETALEFTGTPTITNANISVTTDKNYVTDAEKVVIGNTSGTNTGDQTSSDFTHNDLTGLNAGDYQHLTAINKTDLTDLGDTTLHYHANDRARANHTGTQTASTISDFDTEVSNNTDVSANTSARHDAVTVLDTGEIDLTLTGQQISAEINTGSIDILKLDSGVQTSLGLADSATQPADLTVYALKSNVLELDNTDAFTPDADYEPATKKYVDDNAGSGGTVTSVAVSGSDGIEVDSGSPITTSGTIALGVNKTTMLATLNVEDGAEVNVVDSVNTQTGAVVLDADDISDSTTTNKFVTATDITNLGNLSGTNTGDQDLSTYAIGIASTTDNLVPRFDGTGGKQLQDSYLGVSDTGTININGNQTIYNAGAVDGFTGTYIIGNGGGSLSYTSGADGYYNLGIGYNSFTSNTTGNLNIAIGYTSLPDNTIGFQNIGLGGRTLNSNVAGNYGIAIGFASQRYVNNKSTSWSNSNISIGYNSLRGSSTAANNIGTGNTTIGYFAMYNNTTGSTNVGIGVYSLQSNTTGYANMAIGYSAIGSNTTGAKNAGIGYYSLGSLSSGTDNFGLGYNSGRYYNGTTGNLTTSNQSIFLGANASPLANSCTNEIVIGYNAIGEGSNTVKLGNTSVTKVATNGDFEALDIGDGFICKSPDGTRYRITVANGGTISIATA